MTLERYSDNLRVSIVDCILSTATIAHYTINVKENFPVKDVLIKNALVYDGTGAAPFCSDVLLSGTKIARIGHIQEEKDCEVVDAAGLALAPGFINTHSHMELEIIRDPRLRQVVEQGITTECA